MNIIREWNEIKDQLQEDIRAEVISAELLDQGEMEEVYIKPKGIFHRNYRADVLAAYEEITDEGDRIAAHWEMSREGIYDMLPEGLFHQTRPNPYKHAQDMITEYKRQQKEEAAARTFFLPIEQAFFQQRLRLEIYERKALMGFADDAQQAWLKDFWEIEADLTKEQMTVLMYLLPIAHRVIGKWDLVARGFELILGVRVEISLSEPHTHGAGLFSTPSLGTGNLGVDFVLGKELCDYVPDVEIVVGPLTQAQLSGFLPEGSERQVLEMLCDYFMPVESNVAIRIEMKQGEDLFRLGEKTQEVRLGFSTIC